ncbi:ABC transporter permease subunit [Kitasatospora sp. NBC_00240]|uniref:ABC transporter permease n=1 Tax=Kitasatospora sp. NBC_00240 TaxID=2903567 RepID=UPI00224D2DD4|nr:ABC transporter permease subunit [Kitasatospora sp. NBC_00240]MCX5208494.1 ABC transporter permease subunit [Kitasatospora sp. NBC_00240]
MLVHSRAARLAHWTLFLLLVVPIFALPLLMVVGASFADRWDGALPSAFTAAHYADLGRGQSLDALTTSLTTALVAGLAALVVGGWAALAARGTGRRFRQLLDGLFMLPLAVPSVVVGLALLVAFSKPPLLLNGTTTIVLLAHTVLVTSFAYQSVRAAIGRLDPALEQSAAGLGAPPAQVLRRVTLPLLLPSLTAAFGLCFALSMGELSATMMLYPPDWLPLPVRIFAATDRGALFTGAALAVALIASTLVVLAATARLRTRASYR